MRVYLLGLTCLLGGCQLFFGGSTSAECALDDDCLAGQICVTDRCRTGSRPPPQPDAAPPDAAPPDAASPDAASPDAALVVDLGVLDAAPLDAAVDAGPAEVFAGGRCFASASDVWISGLPSDTHVPRGICTPWAVAWTASRVGGAVLRLLRAPGAPAAAVDGPALTADAPLATDGRFLVFLGPWPGLDGPPTAQRLDLQSATAVPLSASGLPNRDPARAAGVSGHIEVGASESWVVLTFDDDTFEACRRPGVAQWGLALGAGAQGPRAAWFEAPVGGGRTRLVVTDATACTPRVERPLAGEVAPDARVAAAGGGFYWIERPRDAVVAELHGLRLDARGRLRPTTLAGEGAPVELAGDGGHLAVVRYQPARYVLDLIEVSTGTSRPVAQVSARHPQLAGGWLMWAQAATFVPWELRYVDLATVR